MMKFTLRSHKPFEFSSVAWRESKSAPGVRFATRQVSLLQRIELMRKVQELVIKNDFLKAGSPAEQLEAAVADLLVRRAYIEWGLVRLEGLMIDGKTATCELLLENGPEVLANEIAAAIRADLSLSEDERKNS